MLLSYLYSLTACQFAKFINLYSLTACQFAKFINQNEVSYSQMKSSIHEGKHPGRGQKSDIDFHL